MKIIKYEICNRVNRGTEETPVWEDVIYHVEVHCTSEHFEANEAIAKGESYNGQYTVEDDGHPEPDATSTDDVLNAMLGVM